MKKYIKGFDENLQCRGFQFEVGKEYKIDLNGRELELCTNTGFHFCDSLQNVHEFYSCNANNRFCEIEVLGDIVNDGTKCISNHIKIVREIKGYELDSLKNSGAENSGLFNSGNRNSGDYNSGYFNSGDRNSGYYNSGDYNSGYHNSGDYNSGYHNSGDYNSGNRNSGYFNSGDRNSGYHNSGDFNSGFFNTTEPTIRLFNIDTDLSFSDFLGSKYYRALNSAPFILTEWHEFTEEEKEESIIRQLIGGKLIEYSYKEACAKWWNKLTEENKEIIQEMPNFDKNIFYEITGIEL
ncbi:hypothetical protein G7059_01695 [Erysipelothrix sp. HDW6A]|uniref:DUF7666 domain-containing protein n=1 Tax=Erysipelothrix sp. HDW6A TaxID=2714928 RepID=UPI00140D133A|nr:hypothetical protein [Erysipelothrix sp. HDW6A]QIK56647.1 hypothetical protein G7059_01695 [Erysipelothrix sp. HDW6A]